MRSRSLMLAFSNVGRRYCSQRTISLWASNGLIGITACADRERLCKKLPAHERNDQARTWEGHGNAFAVTATFDDWFSGSPKGCVHEQSSSRRRLHSFLEWVFWASASTNTAQWTFYNFETVHVSAKKTQEAKRRENTTTASSFKPQFTMFQNPQWTINSQFVQAVSTCPLMDGVLSLTLGRCKKSRWSPMNWALTSKSALFATKSAVIRWLYSRLQQGRYTGTTQRRKGFLTSAKPQLSLKIGIDSFVPITFCDS